jgi:hypothetical protein
MALILNNFDCPPLQLFRELSNVTRVPLLVAATLSLARPPRRMQTQRTFIRSLKFGYSQKLDTMKSNCSKMSSAARGPTMRIIFTQDLGKLSEVDQIERVWRPGEIMQGFVELTSAFPLQIIEIDISFQGMCKSSISNSEITVLIKCQGLLRLGYAT